MPDHGTYSGYVNHYRKNQLPACDDCKQAATQYRKQKRGVCGTYKGYDRHRRENTEPCGPCQQAAKAHLAERTNDTDLDYQQALCIDRSELFVHDHFSGNPQRSDSTCRLCVEALTYCERCTQRAPCLELALRRSASEQVGVWGGLLASQRRTMIKRTR